MTTAEFIGFLLVAVVTTILITLFVVFLIRLKAMGWTL